MTTLIITDYASKRLAEMLVKAYLPESKDQYAGFLNRLAYLSNYGEGADHDITVVLNTDCEEESFYIEWWKTLDWKKYNFDMLRDGHSNMTRFMNGGLIKHSDNSWGIHT